MQEKPRRGSQKTRKNFDKKLARLRLALGKFSVAVEPALVPVGRATGARVGQRVPATLRDGCSALRASRYSFARGRAGPRDPEACEPRPRRPPVHDADPGRLQFARKPLADRAPASPPRCKRCGTRRARGLLAVTA